LLVFLGVVGEKIRVDATVSPAFAVSFPLELNPDQSPAKANGASTVSQPVVG
jgi:hypothetical protein